MFCTVGSSLFNANWRKLGTEGSNYWFCFCWCWPQYYMLLCFFAKFWFRIDLTEWSTVWFDYSFCESIKGWLNVKGKFCSWWSTQQLRGTDGSAISWPPWEYVSYWCYPTPLQWHHDGHNDISNHQPHDCLLYRLFRHRSKKTSKLCVTGLCEGNSPVTCEFPAQRASKAGNVSIWWRHHGHSVIMVMVGYMFM